MIIQIAKRMAKIGIQLSIDASDIKELLFLPRKNYLPLRNTRPIITPIIMTPTAKPRIAPPAVSTAA